MVDAAVTLIPLGEVILVSALEEPESCPGSSKPPEDDVMVCIGGQESIFGPSNLVMRYICELTRSPSL